ncbi:hypothetical protein FHS43_002834 [Streptosporangium becharense]|uniref:Uncharacterized protein n=1 Tax=Streptosporangium becharense TaxID=1816182 RepID=A0A7W9ILP2_9ACTN|nr:hypothetical protein [Streptosporangium becharense]MBB2911561.1 hypothetical protein [Streptosporangium becharense]MBB5822621.1 hypothetical protein [Streptosporangium becharense]
MTVDHLTHDELASTAAELRARELADILARSHNIPADVHRLPSGEVVVSVYYGLVTRLDARGRFWWVVPASPGRDRPLWTSAVTPAVAAHRIARHYGELRDRPLPHLIRDGYLLADVLLDHHAAASPI